ncbi:hypothetical protein EYF80_007116 [Liparis tanakae]|uniref:Uncharacterized protein n=1 Tax=Liparis tanakae TaxID=230148 RepID=A0A4Z2IYM8_9TELE|nr:hypothetical protein EYF80_007116 [Liparis tanakae]
MYKTKTMTIENVLRKSRSDSISHFTDSCQGKQKEDSGAALTRRHALASRRWHPDAVLSLNVLVDISSLDGLSGLSASAMFTFSEPDSSRDTTCFSHQGHFVNGLVVVCDGR